MFDCYDVHLIVNIPRSNCVHQSMLSLVGITMYQQPGAVAWHLCWKIRVTMLSNVSRYVAIDCNWNSKGCKTRQCSHLGCDEASNQTWNLVWIERWAVPGIRECKGLYAIGNGNLDGDGKSGMRETFGSLLHLTFSCATIICHVAGDHWALNSKASHNSPRLCIITSKVRGRK